MGITDFIISVLPLFSVIPAALLCMAPMEHQWKSPKKYIYIKLLALSVCLLLVMSIPNQLFHTDYNSMLPLFAVVTFAVYQGNLKTPIYKSLTVFTLSFTIMSFFSDFSYAFDTWLHPDGNANDFSTEGAIFQFLLSTVFSIIIYFLLRKWWCRLIDQVDIPRVWYISFIILLIFLIHNLVIVPEEYRQLLIGNNYNIFLASLILLFILLCLLSVVFYFIVDGMIRLAETKEKNHLLEMQESTYLAQQRYIKDTEKTRHDFRHTIGTINEMAARNDIDAIKAFMKEYIDTMPKNETTRFTDNIALNSLLNYYKHISDGLDITLNWEVSYPAKAVIADIDICSMLGNILENAIHACENIPVDDRFIDLTIRTEGTERLFIVATNSFDGQISNDKDIPDHNSHSGLGLISITSTVEKYGGTADFSHKENEFYTDIAI